MTRTQSTEWLDRFFECYYRRRPVNATFIGVHDYNHLLPDFSDEGVGDTAAEMLDLLAKSPEASDATEVIDLQLARGFLQIQLWEFQATHFHRGNPSLYTGEAVFGVISLLATPFAPLGERVAAATSRLEAIPRLLAQGTAQIRRAPLAWTDRAFRECRGGLAFLTDGLAQLIAAERIDSPAFERAAARAAGAFVTFRHHLESPLKTAPADQVGCGESGLELYLRQGHCLDQAPDEIAEYAVAELEAANRRLAGMPESIDSDRRFGAAHYQGIWGEARRVAVEKGLLSWPDFPIRFVGRPEWARAAAPDLYFLHYRSPATFNAPPVHDYLIPADDQPESVIKLNHVIHHGGIGHHVQNWHARHAASRVGQIAAVDCASRIAMFCGGTMAEGWACYATDLMDEIGFLTPTERREELQTRRRMCARSVVDIRLHQGRLTLAEAAEYYRRHAGMSAAAAEAEATKNSMFPGAAVIYLLGRDAIHRLRAELAARPGPGFDLKAFHDRFLSYGSIPVSLIAEDMKRRSHAQ